SLPLIRADRVQLQQVILNLIVNAIQAMSGVGEGARELLISTRKAEPNGVLVGVRDSGPGLAPAELERVFDAFYTTKSGGLGMGLSICRSIIEAHGGRLWPARTCPTAAPPLNSLYLPSRTLHRDWILRVRGLSGPDERDSIGGCPYPIAPLTRRAPSSHDRSA
ncbi:ATP-binding protein, partial [Bradyrhizobium cenepequi]|uniref:ATP-binding protein n=1 Tax=Bradyrhizobium cenepequi TaxID=2821403 RepID=UPI00201C57C0